MSIAELYEVHVQLISVVNEVWQIWLGGTFGFIVAIHIGRDSIDRPIFWVGSSIYLIASIILTARYLDYAIALGDIIGQVAELGGRPLQQTGWSQWYGPMTVLFMILGTCAAIWYANRATKQEKTVAD